jgi:two-component system sensor histidine kinase BaeS
VGRQFETIGRPALLPVGGNRPWLLATIGRQQLPLHSGFYLWIIILRISIGHRLFVSVLLAILAVAAAGIGLMRHKVMQSFSEYAVNIELDRLEELSQDLGRRYALQGSWAFLPAEPKQRRWIAAELRRLQLQRAAARDGEAMALPAAPDVAAPPTADGAAELQSLRSRRRLMHPDTRSAVKGAPGQAPVAEPVAPMPPLPPLPAPPVPPAPPAAPAIAAAPSADPEVDQLGLQDRVTLLDASGHYLAGRLPGREAAAQRAVEADGRTVGYLRVARVMRPSDALAAAFLDQLGSSLWLIVAASVALSALAAVLLAAHFRKPIRRLASGAQELAEGRFDTRVELARSDELGELAASFNQLAQRLGAMEASRRQWVADTSHELRTPLAVLRAQLEAIEDGVRQADAAGVAAMLRQVLALNKLIDQLYALARADVGALDCQRQPLDLWALACDSAASFCERFGSAGLVLDVGAAPPPAQVLGDPDRLRQVFGNLFENTLRYTAAGGKVGLHADTADGRLSIIVEDSAPGVPDEALARLSERFYRVDASRSRAQGGAGLGLALCRRILESHEATIVFGHSPLGGLRATLTFPLEQA